MYSLKGQQISGRGAWLLCLFFLLAGICLFYPTAVSLKGCLLTGDHKEQHYPWAKYLDECLSGGQLPWWTWKIQCGFPLLAEGQVAAFYPPNFLLHFLFAADTAYALNFLLHVFLSGLFLLIFCRHAGIGWPGTAIAALAYLFGDAYGGAYYNITSLKTLCWFPLTLTLIDRLWETRRLRHGIFLGVVFGLQLLAGYLQIAVYSLSMSGLYFLCRGFFKEKKERDEVRQDAHLQTLRVWLGVLAAGLAMVLVFLPQLMATYPLSRVSVRVGLTESFTYVGSFPPWGIGTLLFPKLEGVLRTLGIYAGVFPLFLIFLSLTRWKDIPVRRWVVMFVVSLLLAMGKFSPLYVAIVKITQFYGFRVPSKLLFFSNTSLAILAGLGMDALCRGEISAVWWRRMKVVFFIITLGTITSILLGEWFLETFKKDILQWGYAWVEQNVYGKPYHMHSMDFYRRGVEAYYDIVKDLVCLTNPKVTISLVTLATVLLVLYFMKPSWKKSVLIACCVGLTAADLYAYHFVNKLVGDFSTFEKELKPPTTALFFQKTRSENPRDVQSGLYRIFGHRRLFQDLSLVPSIKMFYGIEDVGAYSPLATRRYRNLMAGLGAVDDSTGRIVGDEQEVIRRLPFLSALNVKYILTPKEIVLPGLKEVFSTSLERVYENPHVQERFFFAGAAGVEKDPVVLLEKVRQMDLASIKKVWLSEGGVFPAAAEPAPAQSPDTVDVLSFTDQAVELGVNAGQDGLLFGSLYYYPGIVATVDGRPVKIHQANACFCAIVVPKGRHRVVFSFDWKKSLGLPGGILCGSVKSPGGIP